MIVYRQRANASDWVEREIDAVLAVGRTSYQAYEFFRTADAGVCIALDGDIQSCERDEAVYHEALVHPAMLLHPNPRRVLIMGGGEGATAREVLRHAGVERVVMVDIDEEFVDLCKAHAPSWGAGAFDDPRLEVHYRDIKDYVAQDGLAPFDVVIGDLVDASDADSPGADLYGADLFRQLSGAMTPDAILATQCGPLTPAAMAGRNRVDAELRAVFAQTATVGVTVPSFFACWGFMLASSAAAFPRTADALATLVRENAQARGFTAAALDGASLAAAFHLPPHVTDAFKAHRP